MRKEENTNNTNNAEYQNSDEFKTALEQSFFKNIEEHVTNTNTQNNFEPVENFNFDEDIKSREDFNDYQCGGEFYNNKLLSTKSTNKCENINFNMNKIPGSNSELLFSGFFGQKKDDPHSMATAMGNFFTSTNPFMEEENRENIFNRNHINANKLDYSYEILNTKIVNNANRHNEENFNGSFLSSSLNGSKNYKSIISNYRNMNNSTNSNSFNDMVKSVSLTNLNKKKKSKFFK
jgi:hypothetical protein